MEIVMNQENSFNYTYSAVENREIEEIRNYLKNEYNIIRLFTP